jgi:hypothetical protein
VLRRQTHSRESGEEPRWPHGSTTSTSPPEGVYEIVDPLAADAVLSIDAPAAEWIHRSHYAGGHALKHVLPECHPVLWPAHFDVSAIDNEVHCGVSAGDDYHQTPYA